MLNDTIVAIASGQVNQAISIIRISGDNAFQIMEQIFSGKIGKSQQITYGWIHDKGQKIDEVLVLWFEGSKNFVGQPTVEINAHGGVLNTNIILELILSTKLARLANPGEFSMRSFLNGKMDLVKAQAINDLIHAQTRSQHSLALKQFEGHTSKYISELIVDLEAIIGIIEVNIDYPEYDDVEEMTSQILLPTIDKLEQKFANLLERANRSRLIFEGVKVAIVGVPNSGKSSLLNALLKENKAIVSEIAGTTRDVVEGNFQIDNILFKVSDTAGIRKAKDQIEQIGIQKAFEQISKNDLIIHVIDSQKGFDKTDQEIASTITNQVYIQVYNKADLIKAKQKNQIYISAKNDEIETLISEIKKKYHFLQIDDDFVSNTRQISQIRMALISLKEAKIALLNNLGPDVAIVDIRQAWKDLKSILGQADDEDLLDSIFSNFCLGK
ncbi:tRNA uridine-5-carboxymethylaminomethyl(34) synthesis GTPase MnmE [Mesomycoplasma conjunctivae]|uniref:tRNA uridine-5-carboxymethylaminomethyl(34) synthesis GTPase MnmE n=1 Tax=Mesomycoplasma conjunctivae TaxID=45361 RepID=UPI003DA6747E